MGPGAKAGPELAGANAGEPTRGAGMGEPWGVAAGALLGAEAGA